MTPATYTPTTFTALPGWADDDARAALLALTRSCDRLLKVQAGGRTRLDPTRPGLADLLALCPTVVAMDLAHIDRATARQFFERYFTPHRVTHQGPAGLLTGYYEPELPGSRVRTDRFTAPVLRRPPDLVPLVDETRRGTVGTAYTHLRRSPLGLVPMPTRQEIEGGALAGRGLEVVWLEHAVDLFFLQVQGSGTIRLPDGSKVRLAYDGKNGHPYTSVGRWLIDRGVIGADRMSMQALGDWLRAAGQQGREAMWQNKSFVFFRERTGDNAEAPIGSFEIPLTPGRSLAVDPSHHALGLPIYVSSDALRHATPTGGFHRLMVAQDVGSAIRGPERGDLFFGSGPEAEAIAGVTRQEGRFFVLLPNPAANAIATGSTAPRTSAP